MPMFDLKTIKALARGNWFRILNSSGIGESFLRNRNGPCPICGGKDRWRWEDKAGEGTGFCHQCDFRGTGLTLLAKWLGYTSRSDLPKLLEHISKILEVNAVNECRILNRNSNDEVKKEYLKKIAEAIWRQSVSLEPINSCPIARYFISRGLKVPVDTEVLRKHPNLEYWENGKIIGRFPALIAKVSDTTGAFLGIHRTYLDAAGTKASVQQVKMVLGSVANGAIKLDTPNDLLFIAEGIETALAIREITKKPTWSALNADNLSKVSVPDHVKLVVICADRDPNKTGEIAAQNLARRLFFQGIRAIVKVPKPDIYDSKKKRDWLDVYNISLKEALNV